MTSNSILGIYSHEHTHRQQSGISTAVLYKIKWSKRNDPKGHQGGMDKLSNIHTVEYYSAIKKKQTPNRYNTGESQKC